MLSSIKNATKKSGFLNIISFDQFTPENIDKHHTYYGIKSNEIRSTLFDSLRDRLMVKVIIEDEVIDLASIIKIKDKEK